MDDKDSPDQDANAVDPSSPNFRAVEKPTKLKLKTKMSTEENDYG